MPWNPDTYLQFKEVRFRPFYDLMELIRPEGIGVAVDVGCGTGEQTAMLFRKFSSKSFLEPDDPVHSRKFSSKYFLGIDASPEMLDKAKAYEHDSLHFRQMTIEDFAYAPSAWDLIFSNAALQWSDHHHTLFPKLISKLNPGGQLAVQMPFQKENALNKILVEMAEEQPYSTWLNGFNQISPVLAMEEYAKMMFQHGMADINVFLKIYPIIAESERELYQFISGTFLIPYMERLEPQQQEELRKEFLQRIKTFFGHFPAIYPFKRLLLYGIMH